MSDVLVRADRVSKIYKRGTEQLKVLDELTLDVERGGFVALMGPSGSGKTTLLNLIGGIDRPDAGSVIVGDQQIDKLNDRALAHWRSRNVGFIFQMFNLLSVLTAERNVELPLLLTGMNGSERRERARRALSLVGLADRVHHKPAQLSGGQEQRVGIARAIVTDPQLLLCDEPTGDLDRRSGDEILDLLVALNEQQGKTIIMVTHDPHAADRAKRTVYLDKGRLQLEAAA